MAEREGFELEALSAASEPRAEILSEAKEPSQVCAKIVPDIQFQLAEREGFEPPIPLRVCRISSAVVSTTHPPLRVTARLSGLVRF